MPVNTYTKWREEILEQFSKMSRDQDPIESHISPSGTFSLEISSYSDGLASWSYTLGVVRRISTGEVVSNIIRNYGMFWFSWVIQQGREFLLCGEDYQGYNVLEPAAGTNILTFPEEAFKGLGFCWADVHPSPDGQTLAVEGCYWACPDELVFFDFSEPDKSPLPELYRVQDLGSFGGWLNSTECKFTVEEDDSISQCMWSRSGMSLIQNIDA